MEEQEEEEVQEHFDLPPMNMTEYKQKRDSCRQKIASKYDILGFISSGTYGRVYKAKSKLKYVCRILRSVLAFFFITLDLNANYFGIYFCCLWFRDDNKEYAIKKFKPDKEGEAATYIGISQSACREIAVGCVTFALDYLMKSICGT